MLRRHLLAPAEIASPAAPLGHWAIKGGDATAAAGLRTLYDGRAMELEAAPEGEALPVLPQMLYDSVKECHEDLRKDLLKHVLLSGAGTLMPGYKKRLAKEMASLGTYDINTKIESYHIFIFSSCFLLYYSYVMTE